MAKPPRTRKSSPPATVDGPRQRRPGTRALEALSPGGQAGTVAPPLEMLAFLLPLIAIYEVACFLDPRRVIAYGIWLRFLQLFGTVGLWAPALAIVAILLATHIVSGRPWRVRLGRVAWMYVESALCAAPLILLSWSVPLLSLEWIASRASAAAQGIGAGIYEELVFRLGLISVLVIVGCDLLRLHRGTVIAFAILASAALFAAHHHAPMGIEPFSPGRFAFRFVAGVYLAAIFWYRGYALAAGCHAAYNSLLVLVGVIGR